MLVGGIQHRGPGGGVLEPVPDHQPDADGRGAARSAGLMGDRCRRGTTATGYAAHKPGWPFALAEKHYREFADAHGFDIRARRL